MTRRWIIRMVGCLLGVLLMVGSVFGQSTFDVDDPSSSIVSLVAQGDVAGSGADERLPSSGVPPAVIAPLHDLAHDGHSAKGCVDGFSSESDVLSYAPKQSPPVFLG